MPSAHSRHAPRVLSGTGAAHLFCGCRIPVQCSRSRAVPVPRWEGAGLSVAGWRSVERGGLVARQRGRIGRVIRHAHDDPELLALVRRYVTPERRYLKLSGSLLRMQGPQYDRFARRLSEDARVVTADEIPNSP